MSKKAQTFLIITLSLLFWGGLLPSAQAEYTLYSRRGAVDMGVGMGITTNPPVQFDLQVSGEYYWSNNVSFGLDVDLFFRGATLFVFQPFGRYHFDISEMPKLVPYVGGGLGMGVNTNGNGVMDVMIPNFGYKYELTPRVNVGSDFGLHWLTNFDNSRLDFHILFAVLNFRF